jgi:hypothetical protein
MLFNDLRHDKPKDNWKKIPFDASNPGEMAAQLIYFQDYRKRNDIYEWKLSDVFDYENVVLSGYNQMNIQAEFIYNGTSNKVQVAITSAAFNGKSIGVNTTGPKENVYIRWNKTGEKVDMWKVGFNRPSTGTSGKNWGIPVIYFFIDNNAPEYSGIKKLIY